MSEKDKKPFALRINQSLMKEIEEWAAAEFRSTNGQIEYLLNEALKKRKGQKPKQT
ncbi:MAG: Arc family DNA binding domain-containing protein [Pedobacter sp.]|nr:MAG: Arc family DNA binding domain-containing protein [Pedobacter sp.]